MYYIVGLGNPGEEYKETRHNIGWRVLDAAVSAWRLPRPHHSQRFGGTATDGVVVGAEVAVLYPETFMNNSGTAVAKFVPKDAYDHLIVVHDEVDLARGTFSIALGGGAAGHNGVASVIDTLGTPEFIRVRVGVSPLHQETGRAVRPSADKLSDFVLGPISHHEAGEYEIIMPKVIEALETIVTKGVTVAMNEFN